MPSALITPIPAQVRQQGALVGSAAVLHGATELRAHTSLSCFLASLAEIPTTHTSSKIHYFLKGGGLQC